MKKLTLSTRYPRTIRLAFALGIIGFLCAGLDYFYPLNLPTDDDLFARVVVDSNGRPLRAFPDSKGVWRYAITLDDVSPLYLDALLNYEDRRFWYHPGIDPIAITRAAIGNIKHQRIVSGGSTLSMQVARLLHPHSRSFSGKFYQMLRTLQLEWHLTKTEILTLYCNIAPFGGTIEGVQAASYTYLNKPASDLTRAEAALLAVLPQSPTRLRPDLHPKAAEQARNKVLVRMEHFNEWTQAEIDEAKIEHVYAVHRKPQRHAPLLSRRLVKQARQLKGTVKTTLDGELQRALEDYVRYYVEGQPDKTSAAVLVVDNQSNNVLAYVGTAQFGDPARFGHVDMVQAIRSPGSLLKPFLVAMALDKGLIHSHSLLSDTPRHWGDYRPGNFSGGFSGPVSVTEALQRSLNIPAVNLMQQFGPADFNARLQNAGLQLHRPNGQDNLAVILGGVGLTLEDLVRGYSAFANQGQSRPLRYFQTTQNTPRQPTQAVANATRAPNESRYFFSPQAAWVTQNMLSEIPRPGSVHSISALANHEKFAWKTGTSYGYRDSWAIGVSRRYTIGVWIGRPDGTANPGASGRSHAGPLLHAITDHLDHARQAIAQPDGITQREICWPLGTLKHEQPDAHCHKEHLAWIINDTVPPSWPDRFQPLITNPMPYWVDRESGMRTHKHCEHGHSAAHSAALWPLDLEAWLAPRFRRSALLPSLSPSCAPLSANSREIKINSLQNGSLYSSPANSSELPSIALQATGGEGLHFWYVNGRFHHRAPAMASLNLTFSERGAFQIVVVDSAGNIDKVSIEVR